MSRGLAYIKLPVFEACLKQYNISVKEKNRK